MARCVKDRALLIFEVSKELGLAGQHSGIAPTGKCDKMTDTPLTWHDRTLIADNESLDSHKQSPSVTIYGAITVLSGYPSCE